MTLLGIIDDPSVVINLSKQLAAEVFPATDCSVIVLSHENSPMGGSPVIECSLTEIDAKGEIAHRDFNVEGVSKAEERFTDSVSLAYRDYLEGSARRTAQLRGTEPKKSESTILSNTGAKIEAPTKALQLSQQLATEICEKRQSCIIVLSHQNAPHGGDTLINIATMEIGADGTPVVCNVNDQAHVAFTEAVSTAYKDYVAELQRCGMGQVAQRIKGERTGSPLRR